MLEKALAFAKAGGVVVGYGIRPCNTPTRGKTADDVKRVVDAIFAQPTALFLDGEPDGARLRAALAKKYPGTDLPLAVRDFDFPGLSAEDGRMLAVNHYVKDGAETLFIANQDFARRRDLALCTKWPAEEAELWDPMQGTVERPLVENGRVRLALEPSQAVFLVWPRGDATCCSTLAVAFGGKTTSVQQQVDIPVVVKETVTPVKVKEKYDEKSVELAKMVRSLYRASWIWHPVNPRAEGKVTFRAVIDTQRAAGATLVFSCDNAAVVFVNGTRVAEQKSSVLSQYDGWRTPTKVQVALIPGRNEILVEAENPIPGFAGFVASFSWDSGVYVTNPDDWEVKRAGEAFVKAKTIARFGAKPWGNLGDGERVTRSPFNESVATSLSFKLPDIQSGERVYFACDDVEGEQSAAVTVNGAYAGGFIGAPYRLDITRALKAGANALEAKPFRLKNPRVVIVP